MAVAESAPVQRSEPLRAALRARKCAITPPFPDRKLLACTHVPGIAQHIGGLADELSTRSTRQIGFRWHRAGAAHTHERQHARDLGRRALWCGTAPTAAAPARYTRTGAPISCISTSAQHNLSRRTAETEVSDQPNITPIGGSQKCINRGHGAEKRRITRSHASQGGSIDTDGTRFSPPGSV